MKVIIGMSPNDTNDTKYTHFSGFHQSIPPLIFKTNCHNEVAPLEVGRTSQLEVLRV